MRLGPLRAPVLGLVPTLFALIGALWAMWRADHVQDDRLWWTVGFLTAGAFLAAALTVFVADRFMRSGGLAARALVGFALCGVATLLVLGGVFGFHFYLNAYGEHEPLTSVVGWFQLVFTSAQGAFFFGVFGPRLLWPWWVVGLGVFAVLLARRPAD